MTGLVGIDAAPLLLGDRRGNVATIMATTSVAIPDLKNRAPQLVRRAARGERIVDSDVDHQHLFERVWKRRREGLAAARRLIALRPTYFFGYLYRVMNAGALGQIQEANDFIRQARGRQPDLSFALAHRAFGAMAPDVDQRMSAALRKAGLE